MKEFYLSGLDARAAEQFLVALGLLGVAGDGATLRFEDAVPVLATKHDSAEEAATEIAANLFAAINIDDASHELHRDRGHHSPSVDSWRDAAIDSWGRDAELSWTRVVDSSRLKDGANMAPSALWMMTANTSVRAALKNIWAGINARTDALKIEWLAGQLELTLLGLPTPPLQRKSVAYLSVTSFETQAKYGIEGIGFIKVIWEMLGLTAFRTLTLRTSKGMAYKLWEQPLSLKNANLVLRSEVASVPVTKYFAPFEYFGGKGFKKFAEAVEVG